jgi:hypothetical protein
MPQRAKKSYRLAHFGPSVNRERKITVLMVFRSLISSCQTYSGHLHVRFVLESAEDGGDVGQDGLHGTPRRVV